MTAHFAHNLPWGTELVDGGARFRLWAPAQEAVSLVPGTGAPVPMSKTGDGSSGPSSTSAISSLM